MWSSQRRVITDSAMHARMRVWVWRSRRRWRVVPDVILGGVLVHDRFNMGKPRRFESLASAFLAIELVEAVETDA